MRTKEQYIQYAKQGHPDCPPECYYVGKGTGWVDRLDLHFKQVWSRWNNGGYNRLCYGDNSDTDYFVPKNIWEEKFGPLDKDDISAAKPITLSEIKTQYEAAKKLVGKEVMCKGANNRGKVDFVKLVLFREDIGSAVDSISVLDSFKANGYVIAIQYEGNASPLEGVEEIIKQEIKVKNTSGVEYIAEDKDGYWQFGCAKIGKNLIEDAHELFENYKAFKNNKMPISIQIGEGIFTREILKQLVDAAK